jgi:hypothetical protein
MHAGLANVQACVCNVGGFQESPTEKAVWLLFQLVSVQVKHK